MDRTMKFHFSRGFVSKADGPLNYQETLLLELQKTRRELEDAYAGFDYVTEPDLIDCYIYQLNAVMKRYRYLLKQAAGLTAVQPGHAEFSRESLPEAAVSDSPLLGSAPAKPPAAGWKGAFLTQAR